MKLLCVSPRTATSGRTTLYRFYDGDGALLYIGITNSVPRRLGQHQAHKPWWGDAARVTLEHHATSMVEDVGYLDGEGQLAAYVQYIEEGYPAWLKDDAVPIVWTVHSHWRGLIEMAPFQADDQPDFLSYFSWPEDVKTGELVDWFHLPVVMDRFPDFTEALGWLPSPLQRTCPLRSIMRSRDGMG
jgi:hypothetical protein